jgi:hypothetical protein
MVVSSISKLKENTRLNWLWEDGGPSKSRRVRGRSGESEGKKWREWGEEAAERLNLDTFLNRIRESDSGTPSVNEA